MRGGRWARTFLATMALAPMVVAGCGGLPGAASGKPGPAPEFGPGPGGGLVGGAGFAEGSSLLGRTDAELEWELDGIAAAGATWIRVDVDWWRIQPYVGYWDWSTTDRVVQAARARGLEVLGMIGYTPPWARPPGSSDKAPPSDPAAYGAFAAAAAQHYASFGVRTWEIWNEPNMSMFFHPAPNPTTYTALLKAAYPAIKAVQPDATVITGGLSPAPNSPDGQQIAPVTFLKGIYAAGGKGYFDGVGHHPSNYPYMPTKYEPDFNDNAFGGVTPMLHQTMADNGDGAKRIWGTEMGAPTVDGMTPGYVADYLAEAYAVWESWQWTGPLFWYSYRDAWYEPGENEANFGLVAVDGTPKEPALSAYSAAVSG